MSEAAAARARLVGEEAAARAEVARMEAAGSTEGREAAAVRRRAEELASRLAEARRAELDASAALSEALAGALDEDDDDAATLSAGHPVVLLPVRVETRFVRAAAPDRAAMSRLRRSQLLVRIYPDEIHATTHEPGLTDGERALGEAFWRAAWPDAAAERDAWRVLVAQMPAPRAAYVASALTPTNVAGRPAGEPAFPAVPPRPAAWSEAVMAGCLPDRFVVLAYRGGALVRRAVTRPVRVPLALSLAPDAGVPATPVGGNGPELDEAARWTVDFDEAEAAGMAVRIPIDGADADAGFDRVLVVGLSPSRSAEAGATELAGLFGAHRFSRGLALVQQGTPTNNSDAATSGFPPDDPDGARSFAAERGAPLAGPGTDGELLARALGIGDALDHVDGADRMEQRNAKAMAWALWPATLGSYMEQMAAPVFGDDAVRLARHHMADHVRGRGPLPALRVGAVPYGVLPVTSLRRYEPSQPDPVDQALPEGLRRLLPIWRRAVDGVPRVGRTNDPDGDLLGALGMDAATQEVRVRRLNGEELERNVRSFFGIVADWFNPVKTANRALLDDLGVPHWSPRILHGTFAERAYRFAGPLVTTRPLSETETLSPNYIAELRGRPFRLLRRLSDVLAPRKRPALLYLMLRHGALTEMRTVVLDTLVASGKATAAIKREREMVGMGRAQTATVWDHLEELSGGRPVSLASETGPLVGRAVREEVPVPDRLLPRYDAALDVLEDLPTAELHRLFTETLDVCSHRIDAWVTSLAAKRLAQARAANATGCHLGAYGWVEDLRPRPGTGQAVTLADGTEVAIQPGNAGYVHAPSMAHAATAAVLRNAWRSRQSGADAGRYAVDLSSARVRTAMELLDAVRNGQPLAAVLGYRFERALHEGHPGLSLDRYIEPFRALYPLVPSRLPDADEQGEAIPARDVVHALDLRAAFTAGTIPFGTRGLPVAGSADHGAIVADLRALDDAVDAVADLVLAEGVHQLVRGNLDAAAGAFDAFTGEGRPPTPEVASTPRSGIGFTHRVAVVLGDGAPALPAGWPAATPRAAAEPALDAWAGSLLGSPSDVRCVASWRAPTATNPDARASREVTLAELGLRPIDVLALARATEQAGTGEATTLDQLVAWAVSGGVPSPAHVEITYARQPGWDPRSVRTFAELLDLARAVAELVGGARPLVPADLVPPGETADAPDLLASEAVTRATQARFALGGASAALATARTAVETAVPSPGAFDGLRTALLPAASFGVPDTVPASRTGDDAPQREALVAQADAALAEMGRRLDAADSALAAASAPGASDETKVAAARAAIDAVFGPGFTFVPRFRPGSAAALGTAMAAAPSIVSSPAEVRAWGAQAARVRAPLERLHLVEQSARALGAGAVAVTPVQLPHQPGERWVGAPLPPPPAEPPPAGRLSLVLHQVAAPAAGDRWAGLLVDDWTEVIPAPTETTAVSFHFDSPGAAAPSAVLVAAHPADAERWDTETLVEILDETIELAKVRAVDSELLTPLAQFLPAIVMAGNVAADTVSTSFAAFLAGEAVIRRPS